MTIRDADRFKDKVEVSLDSRQIFFLFFGGAVVACLVFVLGVMVGKRLESRDQVARRATTSAAMDPLAALDELGADEQADRGGADELAFPAALGGEAKDRAKPLGTADVAPASPPPAAAPPAPAPAKVAPVVEEKKSSTEGKKADAKKPAKKFALQISSFQAKAEADGFVTKLQGMGYKPYVVASDVPDRGIFYRVRIGEYETHEDALAAKGNFERKEHMIAYVTRL